MPTDSACPPFAPADAPRAPPPSTGVGRRHDATNRLRRSAEREARRGERLRTRWMGRLDCPAAERPLQLGHPALRRTFQRVFYAAAREAHHVFREAVTAIRAATLAGLDDELARLLGELADTVGSLQQATRRRLGAATQLAPVIAARYPGGGATTTVRLTTGPAVRLFELARRLDDYLLDVETLYLNGICSYDEHDRAVCDGKRLLRRAAVAVHRAVHHARRAAARDAASPAGPPAGPAPAAWGGPPPVV